MSLIRERWRTLLPLVGGLVLLVILARLFPVPLPEISLAPEPVFELPGQGFAVTNTMLTSWLSIVLLAGLAYFATRRMGLVPTGLQNLMEAAVEALFGLVEQVAGENNATRFFPLVATIFIYILVANWMGLIPGFGSVGIAHEVHEGGHRMEWVQIPGAQVGLLVNEEPGEHEVGWTVLPLLRSVATDLNMPLALALISLFATQLVGVQALGMGYFSKFLNLGWLRKILEGRRSDAERPVSRAEIIMGPIDFVVGVLETVSEFGKLFSFSFRLFGNMFGGEVLLIVMAFLIPYVVSLPFFAFELFVGFMQAFVFAFLTLIFMSMATAGHGAEEH